MLLAPACAQCVTPHLLTSLVDRAAPPVRPTRSLPRAHHACSVEECIEDKREFAAKGKADVQQWNQEIETERKQTAELRKQQALEIKRSKQGKVSLTSTLDVHLTYT